MKKTSVYLDESDVERLRVLAERSGMSQAEVIRAAIQAYESKLPDRNFALTAAWDGDGRSVADSTEDELLQGFGN